MEQMNLLLDDNKLRRSTFNDFTAQSLKARQRKGFIFTGCVNLLLAVGCCGVPALARPQQDLTR